uniref:Neurotransmitter-gated ion-channel ligand-binding domain-containing protein n=1 Tax=Anopheles coluzzii TaxID=1518534 RepID=A0A8W7PQM9_ANOCL
MNRQPLGRGAAGTDDQGKLKTRIHVCSVIDAGYHEKRLLHHLLDNYNVLERPVVNESDPLQLSFGLTLMQIIDVDRRAEGLLQSTFDWIALSLRHTAQTVLVVALPINASAPPWGQRKRRKRPSTGKGYPNDR